MVHDTWYCLEYFIIHRADASSNKNLKNNLGDNLKSMSLMVNVKLTSALFFIFIYNTFLTSLTLPIEHVMMDGN